jgi:hypothetical protein
MSLDPFENKHSGYYWHSEVITHYMYFIHAFTNIVTLSIFCKLISSQAKERYKFGLILFVIFSYLLFDKPPVIVMFGKLPKDFITILFRTFYIKCT